MNSDVIYFLAGLFKMHFIVFFDKMFFMLFMLWHYMALYAAFQIQRTRTKQGYLRAQITARNT